MAGAVGVGKISPARRSSTGARIALLPQRPTHGAGALALSEGAKSARGGAIGMGHAGGEDDPGGILDAHRDWFHIGAGNKARDSGWGKQAVRYEHADQLRVRSPRLDRLGRGAGDESQRPDALRWKPDQGYFLRGGVLSPLSRR